MVAACSTGDVQTTSVPTQTLIPLTATPTPAPPTITPTPRPVIRPGDLVTEVPPILLELPSEEQRRVGQLVLDDLDLPSDDIGVVHLVSVRWNQESLDCTESTRTTGGTPGYEAYVTVQETIHIYHTDLQGTVILCDETNRYAVDPGLLLVLDPAAAEMVAVAQSRLAEQHIVPMTDVQLVDVSAIIWDDGSLGCPEAGVTYPTAQVEGYRIVLALDDDEFIFHADAQTLIPCAAEDEVLPESTAEIA